MNNPPPPVDDENAAYHGELQREYALRFTPLQDYRNAVWRVLTAEFFQRFIPPTGAVLDLGCGWGEFINHIRAGKKFGMDLNPEGRTRLAADVKFLEQDCAKPWPLADGALDSVFTSNFFEHLRSKDDLRRTLAEARRCLRPGGRIICLGPNVRFLPGEYWDFWDHYLPLTERSLGEGMELLGFEIERSEPRFLPYSMVGRRQSPLAFLRLYLKLPLAWRVFGRQFLVIGRVPATAGTNTAAAAAVGKN